MVSSQEPLNQG